MYIFEVKDFEIFVILYIINNVDVMCGFIPFFIICKFIRVIIVDSYFYRTFYIY